MKKTLTESSADTIISDLHRVREEIVDSFGGDLRRLTDDARRRQEASGERIWRRCEPSHDSPADIYRRVCSFTPVGDPDASEGVADKVKARLRANHPG
jgi:hypothetical protein